MTPARRAASRPARAGLATLAGAILSVGILVACTSDGSSADAGELTVFAAASLTDVMEGLERRWVETHPGVRLTMAFDGSNVLSAQISEGAPVDVFVSADTRRPEELDEAGLTADRPVPFARNRVTIAVPLEGRAVQAAEDLADAGVRLVAAGRGVPVTHYAEAAVDQLAATMPDPAAFRQRVEANVVSREDNVRAALAKVELGEGDAAIVYVTDVRSSDRVREVPFPPAVDVTAAYAVVPISPDPGAAAFVEWLTGPDAAEVLEAYGFEPAEGRT